MTNPLTPTSIPTPSSGTNRKKRNELAVFLLFIVCFSASYLLFFATKTSREKSPAPTPTPVVRSDAAPTAQATSSGGSVQEQALGEDALIERIGANTDPKMIAEQADISPTDNSLAAFFGHDGNWKVFGLYLVDLRTYVVEPLYEVREDITGRGGYYMDNSALEFSPSGKYLYMNRTGINFPSFIVADTERNILKMSEKFEDMGHPTWVSGNELLYIKTDTVYVFDTAKKTSVPAKLPKHIFHLRANPDGTRVAAYTQTANKLGCESFDLHIYSYPEGAELKTEQNTQIGAEWIDDDSLQIKKVTGCTKNAEESMFPYSPETEERTLTIQ